MARIVSKHRRAAKPQALAAIDWQHPLSRGLIGAWVFSDGDYGPYDKARCLVTGKVPGVVGGPYQEINRHGKGLKTATGSFLQYQQPGLYDVQNSDWSIFTTARTDVACNGSSIFSSEYNPSDQSTVQFSLGVNQDAAGPSANNWMVGFFSPGTGWKKAVDPSVINIGQTYSVLGTKTSADLRLYTDGKYIAYATSLGNTVPKSNAGYTYIGRRHDLSGATYFNGGINVLYFYNRALSELEAKQLSDNPHQILKQKPNQRQVLYSLPVVGGGGASLSATAQATSAATGALTQQLAMTGAGVAIATANGVINQSVGLSGSAAAISIANGVATINLSLSGDGFTQSFASGGLSQSIDLSVSALSQSSSAGDIFVNSGLSGSSSASSAASGSVNITATLSGDSIAASLASAGLTVSGSGLYGVATATSSLNGDLSIANGITVNANSSSSAAGSLSVNSTSNLSGDATALAGATGSVFTTLPIIGQATASALGSGGLSSDYSLSGAAISIATGTGDVIIGAGGLSSMALAQALAGGSVVVSISMSVDALSKAVAQAALVIPGGSVIHIGRFSSKSKKIRRFTKSLSLANTTISRSTKLTMRNL